MRLENHGAATFEDVALSEASEFAPAADATQPPAAPDGLPLEEPSQTLADMGQQIPHWVKLAPADRKADAGLDAPGTSNRGLLNAAEQSANPGAHVSVRSRRAESGDSWARVARQEYGDERYAQALAQANGARSALLVRGQQIMLPDLGGANLRAGGIFLASAAATRAQPARSILDGAGVDWQASSFADLSQRSAPAASGEIKADPGYVANMRNILTSDLPAGDKLGMAWGMTKYAFRGSDTAQGTAQVVGGGLEVVGAAGLTGTGLGTALAVPLAFHGGDNIGTGLNRIFGGGDGRTLTYEATYQLSGSRTLARGVDQALPLLGGVASLGQGLRLAEGSVLGNSSYRALNMADAQRLESGLDIAAKAPQGNWSAVEHVLNAGPGRGGAQLNSPWISTTRDFSVAAEGYNGGHGLVAVNLNRVPAAHQVEVWKEVARSNSYADSMAYHRAVWAQEVSVRQAIPLQAIYSPMAPLSQVPLTPIVGRSLMTGGSGALNARSGDPNR